MTDHLTDRLSAYLDGELGPDGRAEVEAHLARCGECTRTLDELRRVAARARSLRDSAPPPAVWEAVARHIEGASPAGVVPIEPAARAGRASAGWRLSLTVPQLIAAGLMLMMVSAGGGYWLRRPATPVPTEERQVALGDSGAGRAAAGPGVESLPPAAAVPEAPAPAHLIGATSRLVLPWAQYDAATADLERVLETGRGQLRPETVRAIEQSVASIDRAIEQARQALAKDPANEYLSRHLADNMKRKLELLREAAAIVERQS